MNLKGKFRYVRNKYLVNADSMKLNYEEWYSQDSELGRWLRSKNGIEKIGDYLFLHAGISRNFPKDKYSLKEINDNIRLSIDREFEKESLRKIFLSAMKVLSGTGELRILRKSRKILKIH